MCSKRSTGTRRHAKQPGSLDPAVAGDDRIAAVYEHRVCETEPGDAVSNLLQLLLRVSTGIAIMRNKIGKRDVFEPFGPDDR